MKYIFSIVLTLLQFISVGQTGIRILTDFEIAEKNNNRIISMVESKGKIFVLGKVTGDNYLDPLPYFARLDKNGKTEVQKIYKEETYELNKLLLINNNKFQIQGTRVNGQDFSLYTKIVDSTGKSNEQTVTLSNTGNFFADATTAGDLIIQLQTNYYPQERKYNIVVFAFNKKDGTQKWYTRLYSASIEEGQQIYVCKNGSVLVLAKKYTDDMSSFHGVVYRIDSQGKQLWKTDIEDEFKSDQSHEISSFEHIHCAEQEDGKLIIVTGYGTEKQRTCYSNYKIISADGKIEKKEIIDDIRAAGILKLKDGRFILYGTNIQNTNTAVIAKGKFILFSKDFVVQTTEELDMTDEPDVNLPSIVVTMMPTSSDFLCAIQLEDGRIVLGGRVYMPFDEKNVTIGYRSNRGLILIMDKNGKFRKE